MPERLVVAVNERAAREFHAIQYAHSGWHALDRENVPVKLPGWAFEIVDLSEEISALLPALLPAKELNGNENNPVTREPAPKAVRSRKSTPKRRKRASPKRRDASSAGEGGADSDPGPGAGARS